MELTICMFDTFSFFMLCGQPGRLASDDTRLICTLVEHCAILTFINLYFLLCYFYAMGTLTLAKSKNLNFGDNGKNHERSIIVRV